MKKIKLGIVNLMPNAKEYIALIEGSLVGVRQSIDLYPIRLHSHDHRSSQDVVEEYFYFDDLIDNGQLDLLLVTGAPVEHMPYEDIRYWPELQDIFSKAESRNLAVMGICFGGLAIAKYLGIDKRLLSEKAFGVHRMSISEQDKHYFDTDGSSISLALSTWALLEDSQIDGARCGPLKRIAHHPDFGHLILATANDQFLFVMGHPEYTVDRLYAEWERDIGKHIPYTQGLDQTDFMAMAQQLQKDDAKPIIANWVRSRIDAASIAATQHERP